MREAAVVTFTQLAAAARHMGGMSAMQALWSMLAVLAASSAAEQVLVISNSMVVPDLLPACCPACSWPWPGSDAATAEAEGAAAKAAAADVLSALLAQPTHGPRVSLLLHKLLPPGLVATIAEGPPDAVMRALGQVRRVDQS